MKTFKQQEFCGQQYRLRLLLLLLLAFQCGSARAGDPNGPAQSYQRTSVALERISQWNGQLKAVIAVNPGSLQQAEQLDSEAARGALRGPLHGVPILIKDNIET
jgi:Asp-tRNA(Asn)/Glu-tRNA(Gln) amidotransferase A subunit family amidase